MSTELGTAPVPAEPPARRAPAGPTRPGQAGPAAYPRLPTSEPAGTDELAAYPRFADPEPAGVGDPAAVARASDRGARVAAVAIALAWHLAVGLPGVLTAWSALPAAPLVGGAWLLVAVTGGLAGYRLLRGTPLPATPLAGLLLAVDAAVFVAVGDRHLFTAANWVWSGLAWFLLLTVWGRPATRLLVLLAAHSGIALATLAGRGVTEPADLARFAMYVYGTSSLPVAVFVGSAAIAWLARDRARTAAAVGAVAAERAAAERAQQARQARLALVDAAAGTVLGDLAAGRADPGDPEVQRRCALAAARLRRLIAESDDVPDPLLHELRAAADLAERAGVAIDLVSVGVPPPLPVRLRRRLAEPLAAELAGARDWARLTVVAGPDEVTVGVVTPDRGGPAGTGPPVGTDDDGVEHAHERDGVIRWTQTRWRRA
ncbi:hypothetical protein K7640_15770 [Micromonospora sp. PLK6-60]|uniref:hypothetical protein n=1 Tax=Micromonospora sp. PLK6-60 TaxID=2873383 RepID=UPI001CA64EEF|nr:hypothetical protein [Micromonospora sp. PLK6-60]MBY8873292.1 hypothetical protein [Micromonospora sp. PLK6-60]